MTKVYNIQAQEASIYAGAQYLEPNPNAATNLYKIGKLPRKINTVVLKALGHPTSPIKALRAHCVVCSGDSPSEARKCAATGCALWPMRMGSNPFHGKGGGGD